MSPLRTHPEGVQSVVPADPEAKLYVKGVAATDRRLLTREEFDRIRRRGVDQVRQAKIALFLAINFALIMTLVDSKQLLGIVGLSITVAAGLASLVAARRFFAIPQDAAVYSLADGSIVAMPGFKIAGGSKSPSVYPSKPRFHLVASTPPAAYELLGTMETEHRHIDRRALTPEEAEEIGRPIRFSSWDYLGIFDFIGFIVAVVALSQEWFLWAVVGVALMATARARAAWRRRLERRSAASEVVVKRDVGIEGKRFKWAEFLPDERVWTIEGEPADWRTR